MPPRFNASASSSDDNKQDETKTKSTEAKAKGKPQRKLKAKAKPTPKRKNKNKGDDDDDDDDEGVDCDRDDGDDDDDDPHHDDAEDGVGSDGKGQRKTHKRPAGREQSKKKGPAHFQVSVHRSNLQTGVNASQKKPGRKASKRADQLEVCHCWLLHFLKFKITLAFEFKSKDLATGLEAKFLEAGLLVSLHAH